MEDEEKIGKGGKMGVRMERGGKTADWKDKRKRKVRRGEKDRERKGRERKIR